MTTLCGQTNVPLFPSDDRFDGNGNGVFGMPCLYRFLPFLLSVLPNLLPSLTMVIPIRLHSSKIFLRTLTRLRPGIHLVRH